ncbi:MAG: hypothetical protein ACTHJ9_13865 [Rhodanobacter sp.]
MLLLIVFVVVSNPDASLVLLLSAAPVVAWLVFRRRLNAVYLSPTLIVSGFLVLIGALGYMLRGFLATLGGRGAGISLTLTDAQASQTLILFMSAAGITVVVSGLALSAVKPKTEVPRSLEWELPEPKGILVFLAAAVLVGLVWSAGLDQIMMRPTYMFLGKGSFAGSIGATLGPAMIVVLGYFFAASRGGKRFVTVLLLVGFTVFMFALGSRRFALIPVLFGIGMFLAKNSKRNRIAVLLCAALTAALLPLPLLFRGSAMHGVLPYLEVFSQASPADADWAAALNNVLVSFPIVGASAFDGSRVQTSDIWVSLNPVSGDAAGWYDIAPNLRLNAYTPTAGLGELANVGWIPVVLFFVAAGLVLAWAERRVRRHIANGSHIFAAVILGLSALFVFQMVQYNLRSASRMIVYMMAIEAGLFLIALLFSGKRKVRPHPVKDGGATITTAGRLPSAQPRRS